MSYYDLGIDDPRSRRPAYGSALDYAPLPKDQVPVIEARLKMLTAGGKALITKK